MATIYSGFFHGASGIDASHGVFNEVAGNQFFSYNVEMPGNANVSLLDKLPHAKTAGHRSENHDTCLSGTREAELYRIEEWEMDSVNKRVYWLNGSAGTGKSTIAQTFAERSFSSGRLGASFFCSRDFDDRCNIRLIFPTLAYCLAYRYPDFKESLIPIIESNPNIGHESLAVQLQELIVQPLKSTGVSTTIIVDALDECEDKEPASAILSMLARHINEIPYVKFFITGRPEIPIRSAFRLPLLRPHTEVLVLHEVDREFVDRDIMLYLTTRLSDIIARRSHCDVTAPWPTEREITAIAQKCSGLFIIASIIVEFIDDPYEIPQDRLELLLSIPDDSIHRGRSRIDLTYYQIFVASFKDVDEDDSQFFCRLRLILSVIVLAFNPLSCASLAKILNMSTERIWVTLRSLHSVLVIPDEEEELIRMCHKTFSDFVTDQKRCTDTRYYIDSHVHHLELGTRCLELMNRELKKNICDLPPYSLNRDTMDLRERHEELIGAPLEYACRSWAKHLRSAIGTVADVGNTLEVLKHFVEHHLLSWLEVLSIVCDLRVAIYSLHDVQAWLVQIGDQGAELLGSFRDSERFVLRFFDVIEASAPHIYHSAFLWTPESSLIRKLYQDKVPTSVKALNGVDDSWDACIRTIKAKGIVCVVEFSHRGNLIAAGGEDGCVQVLEAATGLCLATLTGHEFPTKAIGFSPDDTLLASGSWDFDVRVWDLQTGGLIRIFEGHTSAVWSVAFSPCGKKIASCAEDGTIRIWYNDVCSGYCECVLDDPGWPLVVCWLATGSTVVSGSNDGTVKLWDIPTQTCSKIFESHTDSVFSVASSEAPSTLIASGSRDDTVKICDVQTGDVLRTIRTYAKISSLRFVRGGTKVMYATDFSASCFDLSDNLDASPYECHGGLIKFSPDGNSIVSREGAVFVAIRQARSSDQSRGTTDDHSGPVFSVRFSADGKLLASSSRCEMLKLWDIAAGSCIQRSSSLFHTGSVAFSPDSLMIASTDKNVAQIWSVQHRRLICTLNSDAGSIVSIAFSPNSSWLVSASERGDIRLWDVATEQLLARKDVISKQTQRSQVQIGFSPDGNGVVVNRSYEMKMWRIASAFVSVAGASSGRLPLTLTRTSEAESLAYRNDIVIPQQYRYPNGGEWIVNQGGKRICWIPPDRRGYLSDVHEEKVALGAASGRVTILDFSEVIT